MKTFPHTKYGIAIDPRGHHVAYTLKDRQYLGEVTGIKRNEITGAITLVVKHFNGEPWPFEPVSRLVELLR